MTLAERMVQYRAKERLTQAEFAQKCGLSGQTITTVERGIQTPSRVTVAKIELVIGKENDGIINNED